MDGLLDLTIFLAATFASALVAGLSGFAFGLIAASLWLYVISPLQTAALIIAFGPWCKAIRSGSFVMRSIGADSGHS